MLNFHHYSQQEKGRLGKENGLSVYNFTNMILKSRCIIKVSDSENCKYYGRLQHEVCMSIGLEVVSTRRGGFLVHEPSASVAYINFSILVSDLKRQPPFACCNFSCKLLLLDFPAISFRVHKSVPRTIRVVLASCPWVCRELCCRERVTVWTGEGFSLFPPYKHPERMQLVSHW